MEDREDAVIAEKLFLQKFAECRAALASEEESVQYRIGSPSLAKHDFEGEVTDWALQYLYAHKSPYNLAAAVAYATCQEIKSRDLQSLAHQNGQDDGETVFDSNKLLRLVHETVHDICERWMATPTKAVLQPTWPVATTAVKNGRRRMEDRHVVISDLGLLCGVECPSPRGFFAVFDGHAGPDAATYAAAHLHHNIVSQPTFVTNLAQAIKDGFQLTDEHFIYKSKLENLKSGSTAVCAIVEESAVHVAWLGDSQAILARQGGILNLVTPHKPERADERERIESLGGCVILFGTWRVNGTLAVSRAIGDAEFKPYVSAEPDIVSIPRDGTEDFLIVACDGLWDVMTGEDAANIVYSYLVKKPDDLEGAAHKLVQISVARGSNDNISVIIVLLRDVAVIVSSMSCIPESPPASFRIPLATSESLPEGLKQMIENGESPTKILPIPDIEEQFTPSPNTLNPFAPSFTPSSARNGPPDLLSSGELNFCDGDGKVISEASLVKELPTAEPSVPKTECTSPSISDHLWISDGVGLSVSKTEKVTSVESFSVVTTCTAPNATQEFQEYFLAQRENQMVLDAVSTVAPQTGEPTQASAMLLSSFDSKPIESLSDPSGDIIAGFSEAHVLSVDIPVKVDEASDSSIPNVDLLSDQILVLPSPPTDPPISPSLPLMSSPPPLPERPLSSAPPTSPPPALPSFSPPPIPSRSPDMKLPLTPSPLKSPPPIQVALSPTLPLASPPPIPSAPSPTMPLASPPPIPSAPSSTMPLAFPPPIPSAPSPSLPLASPPPIPPRSPQVSSTPPQTPCSPQPVSVPSSPVVLSLASPVPDATSITSPHTSMEPILNSAVDTISSTVSSPPAQSRSFPGVLPLSSESSPTSTTFESAPPLDLRAQQSLLDAMVEDITQSFSAVPETEENLGIGQYIACPIDAMQAEPLTASSVTVELIPETLPVSEDVVDDESEDGDGWRYFQGESEPGQQKTSEVQESVESAHSIATSTLTQNEESVTLIEGSKEVTISSTIQISLDTSINGVCNSSLDSSGVLDPRPCVFDSSSDAQESSILTVDSSYGENSSPSQPQGDFRIAALSTADSEQAPDTSIPAETQVAPAGKTNVPKTSREKGMSGRETQKKTPSLINKDKRPSAKPAAAATKTPSKTPAAPAKVAAKTTTSLAAKPATASKTIERKTITKSTLPPAKAAASSSTAASKPAGRPASATTRREAGSTLSRQQSSSSKLEQSLAGTLPKRPASAGTLPRAAAGSKPLSNGLKKLGTTAKPLNEPKVSGETGLTTKITSTVSRSVSQTKTSTLKTSTRPPPAAKRVAAVPAAKSDTALIAATANKQTKETVNKQISTTVKQTSKTTVRLSHQPRTNTGTTTNGSLSGSKSARAPGSAPRDAAKKGSNPTLPAAAKAPLKKPASTTSTITRKVPINAKPSKASSSKQASPVPHVPGTSSTAAKEISSSSPVTKKVRDSVVVSEKGALDEQAKEPLLDRPNEILDRGDELGQLDVLPSNGSITDSLIGLGSGDTANATLLSSQEMV